MPHIQPLYVDSAEQDNDVHRGKNRAAKASTEVGKGRPTKDYR